MEFQLPEVPVAEREPLAWNPMIPNGDPGMDLIRSARNIEALLTRLVDVLDALPKEIPVPVNPFPLAYPSDIEVRDVEPVAEVAGVAKRSYTKKVND